MMVCIFRIFTVAACLVMVGAAAAFAEIDCNAPYYQHRQPACIDVVLRKLHDLPPDRRQNIDNMAAIGFLAQLFSSDPTQRQRILGQSAPSHAKTIYVLALYRAGLMDLAAAYAADNGWSDWFRQYRGIGVATLAQVRPYALPADNDLLMGAYMASGDIRHLQRILANFAVADDRLAGDALRLALAQLEFGRTLASSGRTPQMAAAACEKYQCKATPQVFARLMTLQSAFWSISVLAQTDLPARQALTTFFDDNLRLKQLLTEERHALAGYLAALAAHTQNPAEPRHAAVLNAYESLNLVRPTP